MAKLLIVYYSRTSHTEHMARRVEVGAREEGAEVTVRKVEDVKPKELLEYDGLIFGTPVYYGSMAAELKQLIDDTVNFHGQLSGKVGAAFASSANIGGGNETAILDILKAFLVHGMIIQGDSLHDHYGPVSIEEPDERAIHECERLGRRVARLCSYLEDGTEE
jgi:NAD(P)H dehydrogenase (quinone)